MIRRSGESGERRTREIECVDETETLVWWWGLDHGAREAERGRDRMREKERMRNQTVSVFSPEMPSAKARRRNPGCRPASC